MHLINETEKKRAANNLFDDHYQQKRAMPTMWNIVDNVNKKKAINQLKNQ